MDYCDREKRYKNPRETANIFSLLTFAYVATLYKKAFKKDLRNEDLYEVTENFNSGKCGEGLEKHWLVEKQNVKNKDKSISVMKMMKKRWGKRYLLMGLVDFSYTTFDSIVQPYALSNLIAYFTPRQTKISTKDLYFYTFLVIAQKVSILIFKHNYNIWVAGFGIEIKTAFSSLLYRKTLKLTPAALSKLSLGNIVTLITKDVEIFRNSIRIINEIWIAVTQVIVVCILLYLKLGPVSFVGIGILLAAMPLEGYLGKCVTKLRLKTSKKTDERLELMQEVLSTIRIIKMYTWEAFFAEKISFARRKEVVKLLFSMFLKTVLVLTGAFFSRVGFYVLIMVCIWTGVSTDTATLFYVIGNFRDLRLYLGRSLPASLGSLADFISAYKRISKMLKAEELNVDNKDDQTTKNPIVQLNEITVKIQDKKVLKQVSFTVTSGLTLITGAVGSGKSSLLKVVLQDYPLISGFLNTKGRIAYASQEPWLFPSTIKQNILFGQKYDEKRYQEVVNVCALSYDFNILHKGDETIVTDRGLNLSKGQQARINLARAVYRESDIYLLDDCLASLDASVKDYIFQHCIKMFLKDKICILVTQTANYIEQGNQVIIMEDGSIKDVGSPNKKLLQEFREIIVKGDHLDEQPIKVDEKVDTEESSLIETEQVTPTEKIYHEVKKEGSVDINVYKKYFIFGGGFWLLILNISSGGATQYFTSYYEKLLTKWIDKKQIVLALESTTSSQYNHSFNNSILAEARAMENYIFQLYTIMMVISYGLEVFTNFLAMDFCRRASINIHKKMIKKMFKATMSFFDTHLSGNVLNRFSQDLVNVDEVLPQVWRECYMIALKLCGNLFLIISVNLVFGLYAAIMFIAIIILRWIYTPTGRSLKRLEAAARSPMLGYLKATTEGLTTIRACKVEDLLQKEYDRHQDLYTSALYMSLCTNRALGFFMDSVCTVFALMVIFRFVLFKTEATAGETGLALTQVFALGRSIQSGVREWAELENLMTSTERLLEYTEIPTERKDGVAIKNWPNKGLISYQEVSLSYNRTDSYVLKKLNFKINSKEKIGIVGRTGAGKSSIISTLFRLYEVQGKIIIDGVDIKTLPLDILRKNIAIIPQDPVLFSGSIRSNLDPFGEFEDETLWKTLEKVGMKTAIDNLEHKISSNSSKFSSGQKQLLCVSRAILWKSKIIVMDEATANMDPDTDILLHNIIKENFSNSTVLTVAHRLHSVMDCDKVMVLDRGEIREFDTPSNLLSNTNGFFFKMVKQAGLA